MGKRRNNRHHILPKSRRGSNHAANIIMLNIEKHRVWHQLFGLLTFREAAAVLIRAAEMKERLS